MNCRICAGIIEPERLEILPATVACSACANKHKMGVPRKGVMVYGHKTGAEIQIMSDKLFNDTRQYYVPNGARSVMKNFSKSVCS
jgi:hypothetical protein